MEDRVNVLPVRWELESISVGANLLEYLEWTRPLLRELARRSVKREISVIEQNLISYFEIGCLLLVTIVEPLHVGSGSFKRGCSVLLHRVKMFNEVLHGFDGRLDARERAYLRVVAIVRIERCSLETSMVAVVERKLDHREPVYPIVLM